MTDPRLTPFSGRVALDQLKGSIQGADYTMGDPARVIAARADLLRHLDGPRDRQLLRGASLTVIDRQDGFAFVQLSTCGYCGWVRELALGPDHDVTHRVIAPATHLYTRPDLKSPETGGLSINSLLQITGHANRFFRSNCGHWVPEQHLAPVEAAAAEPVAVARLLLGVPYLWGGNSCWGIDCSGLVQVGFHACNLPCPADSELQKSFFANHRLDGAEFQRGDLLFWRGHVAFVHDPGTILHATAHSMSVIQEPLTDALARISGEVAFLGHFRP